MKQINIKEPVFRTTLQLFYDCTLEDVYNKYPVSLGEYDGNEGRGRYERIRGGQSNFIWVKDITDIPCIVHELMHFIHGIMDWKGLTLSDETDEVYAYMLEYYFGKILHYKLNKGKKKPV